MFRLDGTRCVLVEVRGRTLADGTRITTIRDVTQRKCARRYSQLGRVPQREPQSDPSGLRRRGRRVRQPGRGRAAGNDGLAGRPGPARAVPGSRSTGFPTRREMRVRIPRLAVGRVYSFALAPSSRAGQVNLYGLEITAVQAAGRTAVGRGRRTRALLVELSAQVVAQSAWMSCWPPCSRRRGS